MEKSYDDKVYGFGVHGFGSIKSVETIIVGAEFDDNGRQISRGSEYTPTEYALLTRLRAIEAKLDELLAR